jgi:hypothetical protein
MRGMTGGSVRTSPPPHDHVVNFYDEDEELVLEIVEYITDGLREQQAAVIVATDQHRVAIEAALTETDVDVAVAKSNGQLICLDARATLDSFMVAGAPDRAQFQATVGAVIQTAGNGGRHVRAFGEMVALLWADGNVAGAIQLESLWNELAVDHQFSLYCAYDATVLADAEELGSVSEVCNQHSAVVAPKSYSVTAPVADRGANGVQSSRVFLPTASAVGAVRRYVANTLLAWDAAHMGSDALLVASELATNAVRHAASAFRVTLARSGARIRISVEDVSGTLPRPLAASPESFGGRGVSMVATVSQRWGTDELRTGKVVWSELDAG